jgi:hypothetical protein
MKMQTPRNNWRMRMAALTVVIAAVFFVVFRGGG